MAREHGASPDIDAFSAVSIVGVGLIGGSLAAALRRSGYRGRITGVSSPRSLNEARRLGLIDDGFPYEQLVDAAAESELLVLCSPITVIIEHLRELGGSPSRLRPGTVITDVGSTKSRLMEAAIASLPESVSFIGGHPLAGSEQSGVQASDPFLFQNAYYVLCPAPRTPDAVTARLASFVEVTGARVILLSAESHDRAAAAISHLPQLLAVHLVNFLEQLGEEREVAKHLAAGGFRNMTRIASSPFSVWRDIFATNSAQVRKTTEAFLQYLEAGARKIGRDELGAEFEKAAQTRAEIPVDTKGFLTRLWDVLVEVEDTPGMILRLAAPLSAKGINIKDIEVLKVREDEGGTMRLAFATRELAIDALRVLEAEGLRARLRE